MKNYSVEYVDEDEEIRIKNIQALNPGHAFLKCKRLHPSCTLLKCFKEGARIGYGYTEWEAPKNQQLLPVRRPSKDKQTEMDTLLEESRSFRPKIWHE